MKLLQLNCWGGKLGTQLTRLMDNENPDIVCLQEANDITARPGSILTPFSEFLPKDKYPHVAFAPMFSFQYMHEISNFGIAIISKFPILSKKTVFVKGEFKENLESLKDDYNQRNFIHTEIQTPSGKINVITHHGHHDPDGKDGSPENTRQINTIDEYIGTLNGRIIFTGDLNLHPESKSLDKIHDKLIDLPTKFNITDTRNILAKRKEVIDFIFTSEDINIENFYASDMLVSDHKALVLDFNI